MRRSGWNVGDGVILCFGTTAAEERIIASPVDGPIRPHLLTAVWRMRTRAQHRLLLHRGVRTTVVAVQASVRVEG